MKVLGPREVLPDQLGAHYPTILLDEASVGLDRKEQLAQHRNDPRVNKTRQDREQQREAERRRNLSQHRSAFRGLSETQRVNDPVDQPDPGRGGDSPNP